MKGKWLRLVAPIAMASVLIAGCSRGGGALAPSGSSTTESANQASAGASAYASQEAAYAQQAQHKIQVLEASVKFAGSLDARLSLIVTAYCLLPETEDSTDVEMDERGSLPALYDKYWQAGGHWSRPLDVAAQQPGACPSSPASSYGD